MEVLPTRQQTIMTKKIGLKRRLIVDYVDYN